jgi:hypothetical protein
MTTFYYLISIFFILTELQWILSPIEKTKDAKRFLEMSKENKGKKWDEFTEEYRDQVKSKVWLLIVPLWLLLGLFTFQWIGFLMILIFNFLIISPISKLTKYSMAYSIIHWVNSLIGFAFGVFVIVNHYHLKIDLTQLFLSLIK